MLAMEDLLCTGRRTAEEEQDHDAEQDGIIFPNDPLKRSWDIAVLMCILYSAVVVPVRVGFSADAQGALWFLEASMSLLFIAVAFAHQEYRKAGAMFGHREREEAHFATQLALLAQVDRAASNFHPFGAQQPQH